MTWIETISGTRFDLLNPKPDQVNMADVAYALARIVRFTGHTNTGSDTGCGYSVAEHALHVCSVIEREHPNDAVLCALALHHDAAEAYVGDVSAPLKLAMRAMASLWGAAAGQWSPFDSIEDSVQACILRAIGLPEPTDEQHAVVKRADLLALAAERAVFLPHTGQAGDWACLEGIPVDERLCQRMRSAKWRTAWPRDLGYEYLMAGQRFEARRLP